MGLAESKQNIIGFNGETKIPIKKRLGAFSLTLRMVTPPKPDHTHIAP
jgi:hypothetical protein